MNIINNFENQNILKFNIQDIFQVFSEAISEIILENNDIQLDFLLHKIISKLLTIKQNSIQNIYKTKINFKLTINEIILYVSLTYYDLEEFSIHNFLIKFEEEIITYSISIARQRLEYLQLNNKI